MDTLLSFGMGFALNITIVFIIVRYIYYPQQRTKDYVFTFFTFNTIIFFVMGFMNNTNLSVGAGFGLFAIFSILRYRTDTIPIREMTYLFVLIALAVVNALLLQGAAYAEFAVVNLSIIAMLYVLEKEWGFEYEVRKSITYERIEMIRPENWQLLLEDLQQRLGVPVNRVEIGRLNFLKDTVELKVYYDNRPINRNDIKYMADNNDTAYELETATN